MPFQIWFDEHITGINLKWYRPSVNRVTDIFQNMPLSDLS